MVLFLATAQSFLSNLLSLLCQNQQISILFYFYSISIQISKEITTECTIHTIIVSIKIQFLFNTDRGL